MPKIQTVTLKKTLFIMEVTVLRKLTYMSQLKFGKYFDLTVQQLLDLEKDAGLTYLIWCYYNCSRISYTDELLSDFGVTQKLQIQKPGKEPTKLFEWKDSNLSETQRMAIWSRRNKQNRIKKIKSFTGDKNFYSKNESKLRNQGNGKII
tara:strand:- start:87 stop:533 length:447 start_codon:yes stop_codon:yes gene_type:complete